MKKKIKWLSVLVVLIVSMSLLLVSCAGNGDKSSGNTAGGPTQNQDNTTDKDKENQDEPTGDDIDQGNQGDKVDHGNSEKPTDSSEQGGEQGDSESGDNVMNKQDLINAILCTVDKTNVTVTITSQSGVGSVSQTISTEYRITENKINVYTTYMEAGSGEQVDQTYYEKNGEVWYMYEGDSMQPTDKDMLEEILDTTNVIESYLAEGVIDLFTYQGDGVFVAEIAGVVDVIDQKVSITIKEGKVIALNVTSAEGEISYEYADFDNTIVKAPSRKHTYKDVEAALLADFNLGSSNFTSVVEYAGKTITMTVNNGDLLLKSGDRVVALHNNAGLVEEYGASYYKDDWYMLDGDDKTTYRKWVRVEDFVASKVFKVCVPNDSGLSYGVDLRQYTVDDAGQVFTSPSGDVTIVMEDGEISQVVEVDPTINAKVVRTFSHYGTTVVTLPAGYPQFSPENTDLNGIDLQYAADNIREQRNFTMTYTSYRTDNPPYGNRYIETQTTVRIGDDAMYMTKENKETNTITRSAATLKDGEWYHWTEGEKNWTLAEYGFGDLPQTKQAFVVFELLKQSKESNGVDLKEFTYSGDGKFEFRTRFTNYEASINGDLLESIKIIEKSPAFYLESEYVYSNVGSTVVTLPDDLPELI